MVTGLFALDSKMRQRLGCSKPSQIWEGRDHIFFHLCLHDKVYTHACSDKIIFYTYSLWLEENSLEDLLKL